MKPESARETARGPLAKLGWEPTPTVDLIIAIVEACHCRSLPVSGEQGARPNRPGHLPYSHTHSSRHTAVLSFTLADSQPSRYSDLWVRPFVIAFLRSTLVLCALGGG